MPRCIPVLVALALCGAPAAASADEVEPSERVTSRVRVREQPSAQSRAVGELRPGERAEHLGSEAGWHRVRLSGGGVGFVSADWSRVVPEPESPLEPGELFEIETRPLRRRPFAALARFVRHEVVSLFRPSPEVEVDIRAPSFGRAVHRSRESNLPVAGYATALGAHANFDIVLAIDVSTSTLEHVGTDVDRDGETDRAWKGGDSILQAQLEAASRFLATLRRLPGNRNGERIRVGVVTFAGDERFHLRPEDRDFEPTPTTILELAHRDAELHAPLTGDYDAVSRVLGALRASEPQGHTDFAAGIGRALIEFTGASALGARSELRPDAQRVIYFMTDGKPRLPYDEKKAERAALYAARMAADLDIRIHTFALGKDVVTRKVHPALRKIASRTRGRLVELEDPADIVSLLRTTSFSFVERVKLVNTTTARESAYIATAIDGSFYGEIPLAEGSNEIEVVAVLHDDSRTSERFLVDYQRVPAERQLADRLEDIRRENEALIEQIRQQLARRMEAERARRAEERQGRALELIVEREPGS